MLIGQTKALPEYTFFTTLEKVIPRNASDSIVDNNVLTFTVTFRPVVFMSAGLLETFKQAMDAIGKPMACSKTGLGNFLVMVNEVDRPARILKPGPKYCS